MVAAQLSILHLVYINLNLAVHLCFHVLIVESSTTEEPLMAHYVTRYCISCSNCILLHSGLVRRRSHCFPFLSYVHKPGDRLTPKMHLCNSKLALGNTISSGLINHVHTVQNSFVQCLKSLMQSLCSSTFGQREKRKQTHIHTHIYIHIYIYIYPVFSLPTMFLAK